MEEVNFLNILRDILKQPDRSDRTTIGTKSIFSPPELRFSLRNGQFPLLTTRKINLKFVFEELMWFLRGQTDVSVLREKGIHIWDGNTNRSFLDQRGLAHYNDWDLGPSYGFQFRHSGAPYIDCKTDYTGQGVDQLQYVIDEIKRNPYSRRLVINLWNPSDLGKMALQPCGFCYQFYVSNGELSCKLTQRSSDIALAGGWNVASASLLTIFIASVCDLTPGELVWSIGDAHIYLNQLDAVRIQLQRDPKPFPTLRLKQTRKNITEYEFTDIELHNYTPYNHIKIHFNA